MANDLGPVEGDSFFKLYDGWDQSKEGPLPEGANPADPYYSGWQTNWDWKWRKLPNIQAGWASAILTGHQYVRRGLNIDCPLLVLTSKHSHLTFTYGDLPERDKDTVIDVRRTRARPMSWVNASHNCVLLTQFTTFISPAPACATR